MSLRSVERAIEAIRAGEAVLIYDGEEREDEVDMVFPAWVATPDVIYTLRVEAGGLLCFATSSSITSALGIPWGDELLSTYGDLHLIARKRLRYRDRTAFTIWVNHMSVRTGVSDEDRSITVRRLDEVVRLAHSGELEGAKKLFSSEFQAPGHVPILAARSLRERRGHTEMSVTLFSAAGVRPSIVLAEMLSKGRVMSVAEARAYAEKKGLVMVTGKELMKWCEENEVCWSY
ncbi:MAG: 3,4-dihydroxy-2-butanone-4-phosphate synthase [Acidilobaceae archaeon]|nr:3,4-dihydroxy-2-butanone-4-phosphate synthase [Acidilobaceae archaeon]